MTDLVNLSATSNPMDNNAEILSPTKPTALPRDKLIAIYAFLNRIEDEVIAAMAKFPQPNPTGLALAEEVGELAQAMLHIREGKSTDWQRVYDEAVQVAAMACRCAIEGDGVLGVVPGEKDQGILT